jgi:hypothetical protein
LKLGYIADRSRGGRAAAAFGPRGTPKALPQAIGAAAEFHLGESRCRGPNCPRIEYTVTVSKLGRNQMTGIDWMFISAALLIAAIAEAGYLVVVYHEYREAKRRWEAQQQCPTNA